MSAYVTDLQTKVARDEERRAQHLDKARAAAGMAARERLTPLEDRLARLLKTIPSEVQDEGLSLPALQTQLRGRWRGTAHPGEIGAALRKLGFSRQRRWSGDDGFKAVWRPRETGVTLS